jgi:hypothetical protein
MYVFLFPAGGQLCNGRLLQTAGRFGNINNNEVRQYFFSTQLTCYTSLFNSKIFFLKAKLSSCMLQLRQGSFTGCWCFICRSL